MRAYAALVLLAIAATALAATTTIGRFSAGDLSGWEDETFRGKQKTIYTLVRDGGRTVLRAQSRGSASGLIRREGFDPKERPVLRWSWKVEGTLRNGNERTKEGDDYPARVYVVFPRGLFWKTKAINYIWANRLPKGESIPNPFAPKNVMMVAVESGNGQAGKWVEEERNIVEDYVKFFGEEPPKAGAIAIMTDTDNTGEEATAWYGDITLAAK
ncbi:MAG: DUF3047 domain-containing protein [Desulfuromonadales bacterium]|nr:MAG: DUF3047 domain-containing protein [Desulfuromonadales bacterium]